MTDERAAVGSSPARLAHILSDEIAPRLAARALAAGAGKGARSVRRADPVALADFLVAGQLPRARQWIEARLRSGASALDVMLEDLAPAARRLGELWRDDDCDFLTVTFAARALGILLHEVAPNALGGVSPSAPAAIFTLAPGETHAFGADLAASIFRLAGWRVERCECGELAPALARGAFAVAGFSLSCDRYAGALPGAIAAARAASRRRGLKVLVGGAIFASRPALAKSLGADVLVLSGEFSAQLPGRLHKTLQL